MTKHPAPGIATVTGVAALALLLGAIAGPAGAPVHAVGTIPAHCVEHTPLGDEADYVGDYHCAGFAIEYHLSGVARSTGPIWAGQWLFVDQSGEYRLGMCTFNRGGHPRADVPSSPVNQNFPNDPTGTRRAYLTWRYGRTTDNLTAAALWVLFHFYAQDAAGSKRSSNASDPLVPSLDVVGASSGRQDIQDLAIALDADASRFGDPFTIAVSLPDIGGGRVTVTSGGLPVAGTAVTLTASGAPFADGSTTIQITTDAAGAAPFTLGAATGDVTVTATSTAPGATEVYRGVAADPSGVQPQTLLTAGSAQQITASAVATAPTTTTTTVPETTTTTVPAPTTTTIPATTTSAAPTTTSTTTSTTVAETTTTTSTTTTTVAETTTTTEPEEVVEVSTTFTTVPFVAIELEGPVDTAPDTVESLPTTGSSSDIAAYFGTALLVAGVGVIGAVRRRLAVDGDSPDGGDFGGDSLGFW